MPIDILNIDCMDYMASLPNKAFDLAIVDPPYGIKESAHRAQSRTKLAKTRIYGSEMWDMSPPPAEYFNELFRVTKNQIIWGGNYFIDHLYSTRCMIVWRKLTTGNFADCEIAWTSFNTSVREFTFMWNGMLQGASMNNGEKMKGKKSDNEVRIHECQKPVILYDWLLSNYAEPGMRILDTHLGSGSIAISCKKQGFDFVGCELLESTYKKALKRFNQECMQLLLL